jgi:diguanylate cyclase (GGDEF)-like protein
LEQSTQVRTPPCVTEQTDVAAGSARRRALLSLLPHGGSLPEEDWVRRHRVIVALAWFSTLIALTYAVIAHGSSATRYLPEAVSLLLFACLASWRAVSRQLRSVAASLALLTVSVLLVDISGGLTEMHFTFFVAVVILTLYEDWIPFLLAVLFVLLHHGIMGTIDPRSVFSNRSAWADPWEWAALHAFFVGLAGIAGVTAWRLNEQVRGRLITTRDQLQDAHDDLKAAHDELAALATTDPLTNLPNHGALVSTIDREIERSRRYDRVFSLLFLDLDHFKALNDTYGHHAGDHALQALGDLLSGCLRPVDTAGRWGGEEFLALLPETDNDGAWAVSERIREAVAGTAFSEAGFHVTCSLGVASYPLNGADRGALIDAADRAMYAAKSLGRNQTLRASDPAVSALGGLDSNSSRDALALTGAVEALAMLVDVRDEYTGGHAVDVSKLTHQVAIELGFRQDEARMVAMAGRLHDVGKVAVPDSILRKPGPLTDAEWTIMRRHPVVGSDVVSLIPALRGIAPIVRGHHERVDGTGYPDGLVGDEIPLGARIITAVDAYMAMITDRPYRRALTKRAATDELRRHAGSQFDADVLRAFEAVLGRERHADATVGRASFA